MRGVASVTVVSDWIGAVLVPGSRPADDTVALGRLFVGHIVGR